MKTVEEVKQEILPLMYCYFGSGMLTNTYDENVANENAERCIKIMEQYAKEKVLEALEKEVPKAFYQICSAYSHSDKPQGIEYYEQKVKPKYQ